MTINVKEVTRIFEYNGMKLEDPDPGMSTDDVRGFYATMYPELTNASLTSNHEDETITYTMKVAAGTKG